jgi:tetratricopeptide (TPR) repeat protein
VTGGFALNAEDLPTAAARFEEALALYRQAGDRGGAARALNNLGIVARRQGDHATAAVRYDEALTLFRELTDPVGVGNCLNNLGLVRFSQGDYQTARALIEEALVVCAPGDRQQRAGRLESLGRVASGVGDTELARSSYHESLALSGELGSVELIAFALEGLAWVAGRDGHYRRAARLRGAAEALREARGCPVPAVERPRYERDVALLRSGLGEVALATAWSDGKRMSIEEAISYAADDGTDDDSPDETSTALDLSRARSDGKDGQCDGSRSFWR